MKQAVKDADEAYKRFKSGKTKKPKFKSKHKSKISFYVNYESLAKKQGGFQGEKLGFVKTASPLPKLKKVKSILIPEYPLMVNTGICQLVMKLMRKKKN